MTVEDNRSFRALLFETRVDIGSGIRVMPAIAAEHDGADDVKQRPCRVIDEVCPFLRGGGYRRVETIRRLAETPVTRTVICNFQTCFFAIHDGDIFLVPHT